MTELTFLIELLLNHELPKPTKDLIAGRIREVEKNLQSPVMRPIYESPPVQPSTETRCTTTGSIAHIVTEPIQAPSTIGLLVKHGELPASALPPAPPPIEPVAVIAQTPVTAAAMMHRQQSINASLSGTVDKISGRPRKW